MSEEMMVSMLENSDKEDEEVSVGAGVVRIHSLHLKKKIINRDRYWKTADHCQPGHIRLNFPIETVCKLDTGLDVYGQSLNRERLMFQGIAQSRVMDKMVGKAAELGMTYQTKAGAIESIGSFTQLCTAWKQDNVSSNIQEQMYSVCVGCFEQNWDQTMELEIMLGFDMSYNGPTNGRNKGCISVLCSCKRSKLVKRINKRAGVKKKGKGNEGNKIRVTRTSEERKECGGTRKKARGFLTPLEVSRVTPNNRSSKLIAQSNKLWIRRALGL
jgi:hypothetical protein